jgi:hypothetical protein
MRRLAVVLLAFAAGAPASAPARISCTGSLPHGPHGLPWRVVIRTSCGAFVVHADGRVEHRAVRPWAPSWAPAGAARVLPGTYMSRRHDYITLFRAGRVLWRSSRPYRYTSSIAVGPHAVAWSMTTREGLIGSLYLARIGSAERRMGAQEDPLGFTRAGTLVTERPRRSRLMLFVRRANGASHVLALGVRAATADDQARSIVFVTRDGRLVSFDGRRARLLGRTSFDPGQWLQPIGGGLIGVFGSAGIRVFRASGGLFASARLGGGRIDGTGLVGSPDGRAVAYFTEWRRSVKVYRGIATVAVLRPGVRRGSVLYRQPVRIGCGSGGGMAWHGRWLLSTISEPQRIVAIDTASHRVVDLTHLAHRLPGRTPLAEWARPLPARGPAGSAAGSGR